MTARVLTISLLAFATLCAGAHAARRVLVVTETRGYVHESIPRALAEVQRLPGVRHVDGGFAGLTRKRLRGADAVVFLNTTGELSGDRAPFEDFVTRRGGFVGTHSASDTFHRWPSYLDILGARFATHGPIEERTISVDRSHWITRGMPRRFTLRDEYYVFTARPRGRVLLRSGDLPLAWVHGRTFYSALGHETATWRNPVHRRLITRAIDWAARRPSR